MLENCSKRERVPTKKEVLPVIFRPPKEIDVYDPPKTSPSRFKEVHHIKIPTQLPFITINGNQKQRNGTSSEFDQKLHLDILCDKLKNDPRCSPKLLQSCRKAALSLRSEKCDPPPPSPDLHHQYNYLFQGADCPLCREDRILRTAPARQGNIFCSLVKPKEIGRISSHHEFPTTRSLHANKENLTFIKNNEAGKLTPYKVLKPIARPQQNIEIYDVPMHWFKR